MRDERVEEGTWERRGWFQIWFRMLRGAEEAGVLAPVKLSFCCLKEGVEPAGDFLGILGAFLFVGGPAQ